MKVTKLTRLKPNDYFWRGMFFSIFPKCQKPPKYEWKGLKQMLFDNFFLNLERSYCIFRLQMPCD